MNSHITPIFALLLAIGFTNAWAARQSPPPEAPATIDGTAPALAPPNADQVHEIARQIGLKLRCPVCQGLSVADSTSPAAVQMQRLVRDLVAQGYSEEQIETYLMSRYGEWIMLAPPSAGSGKVIWLAPLGLGLVGLGVVLALTGRREDDEFATPELPAQDPYTQQLLDEVDE